MSQKFFFNVKASSWPPCAAAYDSALKFRESIEYITVAHREGVRIFQFGAHFKFMSLLQYVTPGCFEREKSVTELSLLLHTTYLWRLILKLLISNHF